jgi:hypothetical protein
MVSHSLAVWLTGRRVIRSARNVSTIKEMPVALQPTTS